MLATSRDTRRWVIPKGWPIKGLRPHAAAAREAFEELGLIGHVAKRPLGVFEYEKRLKEGEAVTCEVEVFALQVTQQRKSWPEKHERDGRWFSLDQAAAAVAEPGLSKLIREFSAENGARSPDRWAPARG